MKRLALLFAMVIGLTLMLNDPSSGGPPPLPATCSFPGCNPTVSDANGNTAGGTGALVNVDETPITGGRSNTALGDHALTTNTTGESNTGTGTSALRDNVTGSFNTANGAFALQHNTLGELNTATGVNALGANTTGSGNTAIGVAALGINLIGDDNTALGTGALILNDSGIRNTAVGRNALFNSTGNKNIAIGFNAGATLTSGNNNIYIGNQGAGDESQTIRIGTAQKGTFIAGIANASVGNAATVIIDTTTGQLGIPLSSARYKQDIETMASRSEGLLKLRPVTFSYKDNTAAAPHYGLIAEEVATVYPELVTRTASGEVQTVKYHELIPMLLNELQRQQRELAEVASLRKELAELRTLVGSSLEK